MLDRTGAMLAAVLACAGLAVLSLDLMPVSIRDLESLVMPQVLFGGGLLMLGTVRGVGGRVAPWLRVALLAGPLVAAVAGSVAAALSLVPPAAAAAVVIAGLAIGHMAAIATLAVRAPGGGRTMVAARLALVLAAGGAVVALAAVSASRVDELGLGTPDVASAAFAVLLVPAIWSVVAVIGAGAMAARPELGGAIERPAVAYRCPRCGMRQVQTGSAGCGRCGLDVRIETT